MGASRSSRRWSGSVNLCNSNLPTSGVLHVFIKKSRKTPRNRDCQNAQGPGDDMTKLGDLKEQLMKDPEFREEYERADAEYSLIEALINARTAANLTQTELAERLGTTQSAVARMEGGRVSPSIATVHRYAEATGTRLIVGLVPADT